MNEELIDIFVAEGRELVDQATSALTALRQGEADAGALERLFRAFHTLKGSAGMMGFAAMAEVYHAGEERLVQARAASAGLDRSLIETLFAVLDQTETWLDHAGDPSGDDSESLDDGAHERRRSDERVAAELIAALEPGSTPMAVRETAPDGDDAPRSSETAAQRTLRIPASRIDDLVAAADELAVLKNRLSLLMDAAARSAGPDLAKSLAAAQVELGRQAQHLHWAVTRLRVIPLNPVFRRFPRLVRETAASLGKEVELDIRGGEVELDKTIVDGLFEPLLHLVRNALDHGLEPPDVRRERGKPLPARIALSAQAQGDQAMIEVEDDGRGIDPALVRQVAEARGAADAATLAAMSDDAVVDLVFAPGFSTARKADDLSGRGVGLDAVRAAVAAMGGRVEMSTGLGHGTRFTIAVPLSVRLARIMTVTAAGETFGIPLESIVETVRLRPDRLTPVRAGSAFVWRDQTTPLLELADLLRLPATALCPQSTAARAPAAHRSRGDIKVVIVGAGEDRAGIAVDAFGERLEAPLRPMTGLLAAAPGIAGATLIGDGRVLIVLDLIELIG